MNRALNLLIVDDNPTDLKLMLRAFDKGKTKNNILSVKDGEEALNYLSRRNGFEDRKKYPWPDVILMDMMMPKLSGVETVQNIRKNSSIRPTPVVMLTTSINNEDVIKSYEAGAVSYLLKPSSYDEYGRFVDVFNEYWGRLSLLPELDS